MPKLRRRFISIVGALGLLACESKTEPCVPTCEVSCGGEPAVFTDGVCPCGTLLRRLQSGVYATESARVDWDGCLLGLTPQGLGSPRKVANDTQTGAITLASEDGSQTLGVGPMLCNVGTLYFGPAVEADTSCSYTVSRDVKAELVGDNKLRADVHERRSSFQSVAGMSCPRSIPCEIRYQLTLTKPVL